MKAIIRLTLLLLLGLSAAHAQLTIEITQGVEGALPIAIVPFAGQTAAPADIATIVSADLARSGRFKPLEPEAYRDRPGDFSQINFDNWKALAVDYVVAGQLRPNASGAYNVQFQLADVFQGTELLGLSYDAFTVTVGVHHYQGIGAAAGLLIGGDIRDARVERAFFPGQFFVNSVADLVR